MSSELYFNSARENAKNTEFFGILEAYSKAKNQQIYVIN